MNLAKPYIDVGLYCRDREAVTAFWQQEVGLAFESLLKLGGGAQQWRHDLSGSILKIIISGTDSGRGCQWLRWYRGR